MNESVDDRVRRVLERDGHTCGNCEAEVAPDDPTPIWSPSSRSLDEATVAVCADCASLLRGATPSWRDRLGADPRAGTLDFLRAVTTTQGAAVADVASVTTAVTGGIDLSDPGARAAYLSGRRRILLRLAVVDRHLQVAGVDPDALEPDADASPTPTEPAAFDGTHVLTDAEPSFGADRIDAFAAVLGQARTLQCQLRSVLTLSETAITATGACYVCLERREGSDPCPACGTPGRDRSTWRSADGSLDTVALYGTITDRLEAASGTTTDLTEATGSLAERLTE